MREQHELALIRSGLVSIACLAIAALVVSRISVAGERVPFFSVMGNHEMDGSGHAASAASRSRRRYVSKVKGPKAYKGSLPWTWAAMRSAIVRGVSRGVYSRTTLKLGGRLVSGRIVGANDEGIQFDMGGVRVAIPWERISQKELMALGKRYAVPVQAPK